MKVQTQVREYKDADRGCQVGLGHKKKPFSISHLPVPLVMQFQRLVSPNSALCSGSYLERHHVSDRSFDQLKKLNCMVTAGIQKGFLL